MGGGGRHDRQGAALRPAHRRAGARRSTSARRGSTRWRSTRPRPTSPSRSRTAAAAAPRGLRGSRWCGIPRPTARSVRGSPIGGGFALGVAWSPDGEQLAVTSDNNLAAPHDAGGDHAEVGEPIESVDAPILAVAFSPDGSRLATGNVAGRRPAVVDVDPRAGRSRTQGPHRTGRRRRLQPRRHAAGRDHASGSAGAGSGTPRPGAAVGQELVGGRTPFTFSTFTIEHFQGSRPAFSPDGRSLAVPSFDGTTAVVGPRTGPTGSRRRAASSAATSPPRSGTSTWVPEYRETCD